jgi:hypothetical protein
MVGLGKKDCSFCRGFVDVIGIEGSVFVMCCLNCLAGIDL